MLELDWLAFVPGADLPLDRPAGMIVLAVEAGTQAVTVADGDLRLGNVIGAEVGAAGSPLAPG